MCTGPRQHALLPDSSAGDGAVQGSGGWGGRVPTSLVAWAALLSPGAAVRLVSQGGRWSCPRSSTSTQSSPGTVPACPLRKGQSPGLQASPSTVGTRVLCPGALTADLSFRLAVSVVKPAPPHVTRLTDHVHGARLPGFSPRRPSSRTPRERAPSAHPCAPWARCGVISRGAVSLLCTRHRTRHRETIKLSLNLCLRSR